MQIFRTLRAQVFLLTIGALATAQAVSLFMFVDERSLAVQAAIGAEATGRAANVATLLEQAPSELHSSILRAANSPLVHFSIGKNPGVDHLDHYDGGAVEAHIRSQLGFGDTRDVRVELHHVDGDDISSTGQLEENDPSGHLTTIELKLSIALENNDWLNVVTRFRRPPLQWSYVSVISFGLTAAVFLPSLLWFVVTRLVGPLRALSTASERLGKGEDVPVLKPSGPSEIRDLTSSFNLMQDRITRFSRDRTQMLAALGHDLRSPLTALRVRAELVDDDETREAMINSLEEMGEMVETTLAFSKGIANSEAVETVELGQFLAQLCEDCHASYETAEETGVFARIRPQSFRRALRNLIENAQRYGEVAEVRFEKSAHLASIWICDRGPGIPSEMIERVFEPYVRLEESRSRDTGGVGLGLSISRTFIRAQGGDVVLHNMDEGGLCATVTIPISA